MAPAKRMFGPGAAAAFVTGGGPATDDDVSITNDGRRLDTAEAVLELLDELSGPVVRARTLDEVSALANAIGEAPHDEYIVLKGGRQLRTSDDVLAWVDAMARDADGGDANPISPA